MGTKALEAGASKAEQAAFSRRLRQALQEAGHTPDDPAHLTSGFNSHCRGKPVTLHAARKWLIGESIPTQEKIRILATWLKVSMNWLRFGDAGQADRAAGRGASLGSVAQEIWSDVRLLDEGHRDLVCEFVQILRDTSR